MTEAQVAQLAAEREAGAEINDLADRYDIDRSTVIRHLHRAGVPGRRRQGRTLSREQIRAAGELYASGLSLVDVGRRFDVDRRYLRKVLPEAGFVLRSPVRRSEKPGSRPATPFPRHASGRRKVAGWRNSAQDWRDD